MIIKENYSIGHIRNLQAQSNRDPLLIERTLFAFDFQKMKNLRKVDPIAYGYLIKAEKLLMDI